MSETYRSYNSFVPEFLRGRPRGVITHCLQRMKKSQRFTKTDMEFRNENGLFQLKSQSGKVHVVDFGVMTNTPSCTCKDWIQYKIPCKHFFAVFEHSEQWKWESLPKHYLESPHITADVKAFDNEYPTVSTTTPNKPLDLLCGSDDPPTPGSANIMPLCGQDHQTLTSTDTREDSTSATRNHNHITRYLQNILTILFHWQGTNSLSLFGILHWVLVWLIGSHYPWCRVSVWWHCTEKSPMQPKLLTPSHTPALMLITSKQCWINWKR